ncbi:hypothetical protein BK816_03815 [Boudabousia tangfeifanii]|uniref:Aldose 1-epimerase n=1 Tax=Boudabousia tangfeifanii TaxID=1912795 RepID=A0A1D9MK18_9ACTO|nr:hypothetical protein [Boudabousia tangfeifanii]AOZ72529.1 hypothetical protein BK816_03815 [Boudabousia tangfeifanii]
MGMHSSSFAPSIVDWEIASDDFHAAGTTRGGILTSWYRIENGERVDLLDGYQNQNELLAKDGFRSGVLAPWSNRIRQATYTWDGETYDLGPSENGIREALHGLVADHGFKIVELEADTVLLETEVLPQESYPFHLQLQVRYTLAGPELKVEFDCTNLGEKDAPVGLGWHPYFFHPETDWQVVLPAQAQILTDDKMIPLAGPDAFDPLLGEVVLSAPTGTDDGFTDLTGQSAYLVNPDYRLRFDYHGLRSGNGVGIFHVYTGDHVKNRTAQSVAIEPCEFMTDAFNRSECAEYVRLSPQETKAYSTSVTWLPALGE